MITLPEWQLEHWRNGAKGLRTWTVHATWDGKIECHLRWLDHKYGNYSDIKTEATTFGKAVRLALQKFRTDRKKIEQDANKRNGLSS